MGLADEAIVRRTPEGAWWAEVAVPQGRIASLVWTAGGLPFARTDKRWGAVSPGGKVSARRAGREARDVESWPIIELTHLLAETRLRPGRYGGTIGLNVIAPGQLARWVLRRAAALSLSVTITPAVRQPLADDGRAEQSVSLLRVRSGSKRPISAAFVQSVINLPYVIVAETFGDEGERIVVDVRHSLPISPAIIAGMVPEGESWVLGPPDAGHWRLSRAGQEVDGASLLETPAIQVAPPPALPPAIPTAAIPVRLVARPRLGRRVDAVLLDETEIGWMRPFLAGVPAGELSFILPGPGVHLLMAPGGLPSAVPFGLPLTRVGPGALYVELGRDFYPHMPDSARQERFQLDAETAVVVVNDTAYRFAVSQLTPSWALWVGEAPPVQEGLSRAGERLLKKISAAIREAESKRVVIVPRVGHTVVDGTERTRMLEQAQRAEMAGRLLEAAELLEAAGYPGQAGRLYERAAGRRGY